MKERNALIKELIQLGTKANSSLDYEKPLYDYDVAIPSIAGSTAAPANTRRIFIADTEPFKSLPQEIKNSAIAEIKRLFSFIHKGRGINPMTVLLLEPSQYPASFSLTDAVVSVVKSQIDIDDYLTKGLSLQGKNAEDSFHALTPSVPFTNPFSSSTHTSISPDIGGQALVNKSVQRIGRTSFTLPFMISAVALDDAAKSVYEIVSSLEPLKNIRDRRNKDGNFRYWAKSQALRDTGILSMLENPKDISKWIWGKEFLGVALGRIMAHEIRHQYVIVGVTIPASSDKHSINGLGSSDAGGDIIILQNWVLQPSQSSDFSSDDQKVILKALATLEKLQGTHPPVATFPATNRNDFPF